MTKKSIAKNYIYNMIYQLLTLIVPLITTPYISRVLGSKGIGIFSFTLSIVTYFILFGSLGVTLYGQREIAYFQDNIKRRTETFLEIVIMRFITLGISSVLFYYMFCLKGQYINYYKILILELIANSIEISWFFQGMEEFKKTVLRNCLVKLLSVVMIFTFVKSSIDLNKYFIIYVFSNIIGNISLWFYLPKYLEKVKFKDLNFLKHLKPTIALFIPQIAIQIYTVLDKTMIGVIALDKAEVGYYEQAQKIIRLLLALTTSLGAVMIPRMANTFAKGNKQKLKEYINKSFNFVALLGFPLMFGIVGVSKNFVPIFYGEGYEKVVYLISIISPIILAIGFSSVIGTQYLLPTKQQKKFTLSVTIGAIVNFILNIICIKYFKSIGASIATVIAEFSVTLVQFYLVRKDISIKDLISICNNYFISALIMFIGLIFIEIIIKNKFISLIIQIIIGFIIYLVILLLMRDKLVYEILDKLKNIFKYKFNIKKGYNYEKK